MDVLLVEDRISAPWSVQRFPGNPTRTGATTVAGLAAWFERRIFNFLQVLVSLGLHNVSPRVKLWRVVRGEARGRFG